MKTTIPLLLSFIFLFSCMSKQAKPETGVDTQVKVKPLAIFIDRTTDDEYDAMVQLGIRAVLSFILHQEEAQRPIIKLEFGKNKSSLKASIKIILDEIVMGLVHAKEAFLFDASLKKIKGMSKPDYLLGLHFENTTKKHVYHCVLTLTSFATKKTLSHFIIEVNKQSGSIQLLD